MSNDVVKCKTKYKNLAQVLRENNIDYSLIAKEINVSIKTFYRKLIGEMDFYLNDVMKIVKILNYKYSIDFLFRE